MDFAAFRKQNSEKAPVTKVDADPIDSATGLSGEAETEHQNQVLLKMPPKSKAKWIPRGPNIKAPGLTAESMHHKVRIHFDGRSEVRLVDDVQLEALKKARGVSKVVHMGRSKANGELLEYVTESAEEMTYQHADGRKASIQRHKYADPSLGEDHYVHLPDARATVYPEFEKAHKLLSKLGYKPSKE
jgi:hypothetical protein